MLFNSFAFILFFLAFFAGWPLARKMPASRWIYIIAFSLFFYGWWSWKYVLLLVATALVDFCAGLSLVRFQKKAKWVLGGSIAINLGVLGFFKYAFISAQSLNGLLAEHGVAWQIPLMNVVLPVGISFYTFQSMSYTIDVYRGACKPVRNFFHFLSAISLFPHLVAGPIMRASKLLPQLLYGRAATYAEQVSGLRLIAHGFFKKVVIADNLAATVNDAFAGTVSAHSSLDWWLVAVMFSMQIYCDFSGYSDIARGLARWMGYDFSLNFNHPYFSKSLKEFWERWHISLSTWFRDYIYVPMGGSRHGAWKTYRNIFVTMLLSALWHGAGLTYLAWGCMHAVLLCVERATQWPDRLQRGPVTRSLARLLILIQVGMAWVFFRAVSYEQGVNIIAAMLTFGAMSFDLSITAVAFLILGVGHEVYLYRSRAHFQASIINVLELAVLTTVILGSIFLRGPGNAFVYFQF